MAPMSSTRGVSFDPAEAASERSKRQVEIDQMDLHASAHLGVPPRKQHARHLDRVNAEVRKAYQERRR